MQKGLPEGGLWNSGGWGSIENGPSGRMVTGFLKISRTEFLRKFLQLRGVGGQTRRCQAESQCVKASASSTDRLYRTPSEEPVQGVQAPLRAIAPI